MVISQPEKIPIFCSLPPTQPIISKLFPPSHRELRLIIDDITPAWPCRRIKLNYHDHDVGFALLQTNVILSFGLEQSHVGLWPASLVSDGLHLTNGLKVSPKFDWIIFRMVLLPPHLLFLCQVFLGSFSKYFYWIYLPVY